jgi:exodeoxyribonuclease VII large subunit
VETDENGRTIARMRAVIWRTQRERIEQKLREAGCERSLDEEQEICALAAIRFHPVYGLSLEISDVDPTLGVSLLERNRHEVLERLEAANLLHLNKSHSLPVASLRIGLITASGSAAYADFTKTLLMSGFSFRVSLVQATVQGEAASAQVVRAIRMLERQNVDVICLVWGGGFPLELGRRGQE